jgi:hypothetical protein
MDNLIYREYQPNDENEIVQLLSRVFHGWPKFDIPCNSVDHWKWKYLENPHGGSAVVVCIDNDRIIACLHSYLIKLKVGEDTILGSQNMDMAVDPGYRKMGISYGIGNAHDSIKVDRGSVLNYSVSGNPIMWRRGLKRGRIPFPSEIICYCNKLDLSGSVDRGLIKRIGIPVYKRINKLLRGKHNFSSDLIVEKNDKFDDRFFPLINDVIKDSSFAISMDSDYLNWRYCDPRGGRYMVYSVVENDIPMGFSCLRIKRDNLVSRGYIVELVCKPNRIDALFKLLENALLIFRAEMLNEVTCWAFERSILEEELLRLGFLSREERPFISIMCDEERFSQILNDSNKHHFCYGYSDWI